MALNSEPVMIREQITHQLGQQLLDAYCRGLFGKVSKQEIDVMVFSAAVKSLFCDHFEFFGNKIIPCVGSGLVPVS